jgi:hypothetical protein
MPPRLRWFYAALSFVLFLVAAAPLFRELGRPRDLWWTPQTMLVPLAQAGDRVEIYVRGEPLPAMLEAGRLQVPGSSVLATGDFGLRFNNAERVRAAQIPMLLASAFACGVTALLFLLALTGSIAYRGERAA